MPWKFRRTWQSHVLEGFRRIGQQRLVVDFGADDRVRADHRRTCRTGCRSSVPRPGFQGDIAFLPLRGAGREGAVHRA